MTARSGRRPGQVRSIGHFNAQMTRKALSHYFNIFKNPRSTTDRVLELAKTLKHYNCDCITIHRSWRSCYSSVRDLQLRDGKNAVICQACHLVAYCSVACREAHRQAHDPICNAFILDTTFIPKHSEGTIEGLLMPLQGHSHYDPEYNRSYLYGNTPALDLIQLSANEGAMYDQPFKMLFAASGDLRSPIKSLVQLPSSFQQPLEIHVNDHNPLVVIRNVAIMLLLLTGSDGHRDTAIHLWYSAFLTISHWTMLQDVCLPVVKKVLMDGRKSERYDNDQLELAINVGLTIIRIRLLRSLWIDFYDILKAPVRTHTTKTLAIRVSTADMEAQLYDMQIDRHRRLAVIKFWATGVLAPFQADVSAYNIANPTMFSERGQLCQSWTSWDVFQCWTKDDVATYTADSGRVLPKNDIYGKMHLMMHSLLNQLIESFSTRTQSWTFYCGKLENLPEVMSATRFDRIDTSNVADRIWGGPEVPLKLGEKLLNPCNPHATLITHFMRACIDHMRDSDATGARADAREYLGVETETSPHLRARTLNVAHAAISRELLWGRFKNTMYEPNGPGWCMRPVYEKTHNTVVPPWPWGLKGRDEVECPTTEILRARERLLFCFVRFVEWRLPRAEELDHLGVLKDDLEEEDDGKLLVDMDWTDEDLYGL